MLALGAALAVVLAGREAVTVFLIEHSIYKIHNLFGLRISSYALSVADILASGLFAAVIGGFILSTFRKTVSAEVFFFAFWLGSVSFESLRLAHLALALAGWNEMMLAYIDKLYIGIRFLGTMSIFISGLYAAGMRNDKQFSIMAACAGIGAALTSILPVNTGIWEFNLMYRVGYSRLIEGFSLAFILITLANYLIAVRIRGDRAYYYIALGIAAVTSGSHFVGLDVSPLLSIAAVGSMTVGSVLFIRKLHSFYLWQ